MFRSETFRVFAMAILILVAVFTTGCNPVSFEKIDPSVKAKLISDQGVFRAPPGRAPAESNDGSSDPYGSGNPNETNTGSTDPYGTGGGSNPPTSSTGGSSPVSGGAFPVIGGTGGSTQPGSGGSTSPSTGGSTSPSTGTGTQPVNNGGNVAYPELPLSPAEIPIYFICSNSESRDKGVNFVSTSSLKVEVVQYKDGIETGRCLENSSAVGAIKSTKKLKFSNCAPKGKMTIRTPLNYGTTGTEAGAQAQSGDHFSVNFIADAGVNLLSQRVLTTGAKIHVLFDINGLPSSVSGLTSNATNQALCDQNASPLFVDLRSNFERTKQFSLKAPWDGVLFDILGKNADPVAHTPNRISWFESSAMGYIALPNKRGQVLGIDQLFGDNTSGPDGKFASDGYAALAKYDANKDEVIDIEDAVYAKLKIWQDKNLDGKAEASELKSLADAKIEVIDLRYDANFSEQDIYGNTIKYKSVVKMANGEYRLMFDIWFELNLYKARQRYLELTSL